MLRVLVLGLLAWAPEARAQVLRHELTLRHKAGGGGTLEGGGASFGELSSVDHEFAYLRRLRLGGSTDLVLGPSYRLHALERPAGAPLPRELAAASFRLGAELLLSPRWWVFAGAQPGWYGERSALSGDSFNAPGALTFNHLLRPNLRLLAGVSVDAFRGSDLAPFAGLTWRPSPRWNLELVLPDLRVEYRAREGAGGPLDLFAGLALDGASYKLGPGFGTAAGLPSLDGARLDRREAAAQAGLTWYHRGLRADLSGGWLLLRTYDFHEAGLELEAPSAPFLSASLKWGL